MRRSRALSWVLRRLNRLGLVKFVLWSLFLFGVLPIVATVYFISTAVSPYSFLLKHMSEPRTIAVVPMPSANASLVVVDMINTYQKLIERWLYVRYANEMRSDEELGYTMIWAEPGREGIDRYDTSTWVSAHLAMPSGEMCIDILIWLKISRNRTRLRKLSFGLNNGMLHSYHGSMMRDNGTLVTVEQSSELIDVCRKWFALIETEANKVVHASYGDWIDKATAEGALYDQIIVREREESDGNAIYYPNRVFKEKKIVPKLHGLLADGGYLVIYLARLDRSDTQDIEYYYKNAFDQHCTSIEPSKSRNSYLFCQKTDNTTQFEQMHRGISKFIEVGC